MWPVAITILLITTGYFLCFPRAGRKGPFPPGPRGIPVLGNALQFSSTAWLDFEKFKNKYGPFFYLNILGQPFIILNDAKTAADLLSRRSHKYSDRPRNIVGSEILSGNLNFAVSSTGDTTGRWRRQRRAAHEGLHNDVNSVFNSVQSLESLILADKLLHDTDSWYDHLQRSAVSMIMSITYSLPPLRSLDDPAVLRIKAHADRLLYSLYPGNYLCEFFPWMKHLPSWAARWKRDAEGFFKTDAEFFLKLYHEAAARYNKDEQPGFVASLARRNHQPGLSELEAAWLAATMYGAGAETTATVLRWFMVAMVCYPGVQKQAQAELDSVVGHSRPPSFDDYKHLPYIRAIVIELLRWRPPGPLGVPHRSTEDDWYEGYFIPKGTVCIANMWAINRDTNLFGPDAHDFNPGRHLDKDGRLRPALPDFQGERHSTYGFGKRECVGKSVANASLFINVATILWATHINPLIDDQGITVLLDVNNCSNAETGISLHPAPFKCCLTARSPDTVFLLNEAFSLCGYKR